MILKYLLEKEFKQLLRDKFQPRLFVMLPLMMLLVMPWAANQEVRGLKLCVVDCDGTPASRRLVEQAATSAYFDLTVLADDGNRALRAVESGDADLVMELPRGFGRDLVRDGRAEVQVSANAVNGIKAGMGSMYLAQVIASYSRALAEERGAAVAGSGRPTFRVEPHYCFNPHLDYKVFMIPAMMVMMLTLLAGFLPALNIVGEKERGTMEQMNVTPVGKLKFVLSKLIPYWCVGFFVLAWAMLLAWLIYGLVPVGSVLTVFLSASVYILAVSGFGLVVSNYSETMQQALFVMYFFLIIFILMSGLFTPVASMPDWAQALTRLNPLRYFIEVMRAVYLKGSSLSQLLPQLSALGAHALVMGGWAVWSYRKNS